MQHASCGCMRIALIAPPLLPLPPVAYAGIERVITALAEQLHGRGHVVSVFAPGDSSLRCEVVPTVPAALWPAGYRGDAAAYLARSVALAWDQSARFDVIHSHVETNGFLLARYCSTPVLTTLHGRLDGDGIPELLDLFSDIPLVAISNSQRRWSPNANWLATVHHGLDFSTTPFSDQPGSYLLFVGRIAPEKGVTEAIEVARLAGLKLVAAAKVHRPEEVRFYQEVIVPAVNQGIVDWRGEVDEPERDRLMAGALATLMLGASPEPFGLVAIESMATGTPVIARRAGALTETVVHGSTGFLVDDQQEATLAVARAATVNRGRLRAYARGRFSADVMTDAYEHLYQALAGTVARERAGSHGISRNGDRAVRRVIDQKMLRSLTLPALADSQLPRERTG
jgi:glycosyltransferase involved in cell wall biosynthesis